MLSEPECRVVNIKALAALMVLSDRQKVFVAEEAERLAMSFDEALASLAGLGFDYVTSNDCTLVLG